VCVLFVYKSNVCYMPGMLYHSWSEEGEESAGVIGDMQMLMVHSTPHDAPSRLLLLLLRTHTHTHHPTHLSCVFFLFLCESHWHTTEVKNIGEGARARGLFTCREGGWVGGWCSLKICYYKCCSQRRKSRMMIAMDPQRYYHQPASKLHATGIV